MAERTDLVTRFERNVERLTVDDWKRVYDARPLGYGSALLTSRDHYSSQTQAALDAQERLIAVLDRTLGDAQKAEARGGGRVNFLSYCMDRLSNALDAIGKRDVVNPDSFVAGYGPFLQVISPSAVGIVDEIAELSDPAVRTPMIERYAELLKTLNGRQTAADAHLTDDPARISLALCLESVGASEGRRADLEEMYVALCAFPSVAASASDKDADQVRACQNARLKWLGYENARFSEGDRLTIGARAVQTVAKEDARVQELLVIGGFTPSAVVLAAALVATGGQPGLLGLIAPLLAGAAGSIVGFTAYSVLSGRSKHGSTQRKLAFAISVALVLGIAAASVYLYVWVIPR